MQDFENRTYFEMINGAVSRMDDCTFKTEWTKWFSSVDKSKLYSDAGSRNVSVDTENVEKEIKNDFASFIAEAAVKCGASEDAVKNVKRIADLNKPDEKAVNSFAGALNENFRKKEFFYDKNKKDHAPDEIWLDRILGEAGAENNAAVTLRDARDENKILTLGDAKAYINNGFPITVYSDDKKFDTYYPDEKGELTRSLEFDKLHQPAENVTMTRRELFLAMKKAVFEMEESPFRSSWLKFADRVESDPDKYFDPKTTDERISLSGEGVMARLNLLHTANSDLSYGCGLTADAAEMMSSILEKEDGTPNPGANKFMNNVLLSINSQMNLSVEKSKTFYLNDPVGKKNMWQSEVNKHLESYGVMPMKGYGMYLGKDDTKALSASEVEKALDAGEFVFLSQKGAEGITRIPFARKDGKIITGPDILDLKPEDTNIPRPQKGFFESQKSYDAKYEAYLERSEKINDRNFRLLQAKESIYGYASSAEQEDPSLAVNLSETPASRQLTRGELFNILNTAMTNRTEGRNDDLAMRWNAASAQFGTIAEGSDKVTYDLPGSGELTPINGEMVQKLIDSGNSKDALRILCGECRMPADMCDSLANSKVGDEEVNGVLGSVVNGLSKYDSVIMTGQFTKTTITRAEAYYAVKAAVMASKDSPERTKWLKAADEIEANADKYFDSAKSGEEITVDAGSMQKLINDPKEAGEYLGSLFALNEKGRDKLMLSPVGGKKNQPLPVAFMNSVVKNTESNFANYSAKSVEFYSDTSSVRASWHKAVFAELEKDADRKFVKGENGPVLFYADPEASPKVPLTRREVGELLDSGKVVFAGYKENGKDAVPTPFMKSGDRIVSGSAHFTGKVNEITEFDTPVPVKPRAYGFLKFFNAKSALDYDRAMEKWENDKNAHNDLNDKLKYAKDCCEKKDHILAEKLAAKEAAEAEKAAAAKEAAEKKLAAEKEAAKPEYQKVFEEKLRQFAAVNDRIKPQPDKMQYFADAEGKQLLDADEVASGLAEGKLLYMRHPNLKPFAFTKDTDGKGILVGKEAVRKYEEKEADNVEYDPEDLENDVKNAAKAAEEKAAQEKAAKEAADKAAKDAEEKAAKEAKEAAEKAEKDAAEKAAKEAEEKRISEERAEEAKKAAEKAANDAAKAKAEERAFSNMVSGSSNLGRIAKGEIEYKHYFDNASNLKDTGEAIAKYGDPVYAEKLVRYCETWLGKNRGKAVELCEKLGLPKETADKMKNMTAKELADYTLKKGIETLGKKAKTLEEAVKKENALKAEAAKKKTVKDEPKKEVKAEVKNENAASKEKPKNVSFTEENEKSKSGQEYLETKKKEAYKTLANTADLAQIKKAVATIITCRTMEKKLEREIRGKTAAVSEEGKQMSIKARMAISGNDAKFNESVQAIENSTGFQKFCTSRINGKNMLMKYRKELLEFDLKNDQKKLVIKELQLVGDVDNEQRTLDENAPVKNGPVGEKDYDTANLLFGVGAV